MNGVMEAGRKIILKNLPRHVANDVQLLKLIKYYKMIKIFAGLLFSVFVFSNTYSQNTSNPSVQLAQKIARKMQDSLLLTVEQKDQLYNINLLLHNQKMAARQQYNKTDSLQKALQGIENARDSLYHAVLPDDKYLLYMQKKDTLINSN